jgi:hypothetical protein
MHNERLDAIAKALNISPDAIKSFSEDAAFNIIANTYHNHASSVNYQFNPIEKILQLYVKELISMNACLKEKRTD